MWRYEIFKTVLYRIFAFVILSFLTLSLTSCIDDTNDEVDYNPNVLSSKDYVFAEDALFEVVNAFLKGIHDTSVIQYGYGFIDYCDVSWIPAENKMRFGYGDVDRFCEDGKFRRGTFYARFNGPVFEQGTRAEITTDSLFVNNNLLECSASIEHIGPGNDGHIVYRLQVTDSRIILPDTTGLFTVSLMTDFEMSWIEGSSTPSIHEDDLFQVEGSAEGTSGNGYSFQLSISAPLENFIDCYWISSGYSQMTVSSARYPEGDIDYIVDDGCFNKVYFYVNDNTFFDYIDIRE